VARHLSARAGCDLDVLVRVREREQILDLFELVTGYRMHTRYFQVGGLAEDIPRGFYPECRKFCDWMPKAVDDYETLLTRNKIWLERTEGLGLLSRTTRSRSGSPGRCCARPGVDWDLRRAQRRYLATPSASSALPAPPRRDVYARYRCALEEMRASQVRIASQCPTAWKGWRGSRGSPDDRKVVLPPARSCPPRWSP
jgi:NADH-quinone oxidoreductase subunit D